MLWAFAKKEHYSAELMAAACALARCAHAELHAAGAAVHGQLLCMVNCCAWSTAVATVHVQRVQWPQQLAAMHACSRRLIADLRLRATKLVSQSGQQSLYRTRHLAYSMQTRPLGCCQRT